VTFKQQVLFLSIVVTFKQQVLCVSMEKHGYNTSYF